MSVRSVLLPAASMASLLTLGCMAQTPGGIEAVSLQPSAKAGVFVGRPAIAKVTPANGMGRLNFDLTLKFPANPVTRKFGLLALPTGTGATAAAGALGSFDNAKVTLWSPTASATYDDTKHAVSIPFASFSAGVDVDGYHTASAGAAFNMLRPSTDYQSRIFITDDDANTTTDRLSASATNTGVTIQAGANNVDFTCTVNGQMLSYSIANSTAKNNVSDGGFVKGDTVTFNTGIANNQPGVTQVDVELSGAAYAAGCRIARLTTAASFASFSWNSGANAETYVAASLSAPATGTTGTAGVMTIKAYNSNGLEVGRSTFNVTVFGAPTSTTIRIK